VTSAPPTCALRARDRDVRFPRRPLVMGILNINDDSFSGDGTLDPALALDRACAMACEGADILDVGGESARTNRGPISEQEEIDRVLPFLHALPARLAALAPPGDPDQIWPPLISANTWRPDVAEAMLAAGADLLNDIGGFPDDTNARIAARHGAALVIMHSVGAPKVPHTHVQYPDILDTLDRFFEEKLALADRAGLPREAVILDPGIDFAKQRADNLRIYLHLDRLQRFERPILLPVSRKTVIGDVLDIPSPAGRDAGTAACIVRGCLAGAAIFRVHNVGMAAQAVRISHAVETLQFTDHPL
jgi:dihydropteroate synthase